MEGARPDRFKETRSLVALVVAEATPRRRVAMVAPVVVVEFLSFNQLFPDFWFSEGGILFHLSQSYTPFTDQLLKGVTTPPPGQCKMRYCV